MLDEHRHQRNSTRETVLQQTTHNINSLVRTSTMKVLDDHSPMVIEAVTQKMQASQSTNATPMLFSLAGGMIGYFAIKLCADASKDK